ncbi:hypothetical protein T484DRAFT_1892998 [Baffinella frigidus]|nr:hypothetical protein T484DRAFT_1892998 [Cryptophyta sp. CCMP2293]
MDSNSTSYPLFPNLIQAKYHVPGCSLLALAKYHVPGCSLLALVWNAVLSFVSMAQHPELKSMAQHPAAKVAL